MESTPAPTGVSGARSRYELLRVERDMFLQRAREASRLTLPSLVPPEGHTGSNDLFKPFQSLGSRGVNNLAAKILLALLPANTPFSRFKINDMDLEKAIQGNAEFKTELEEALAKSERAIQDEVETSGIRADTFEVIKHLVVAGNRLVYEPKSGGMQSYALSQYCVLRDPKGNLLEIVLKEIVAPAALPESYHHLCVKDNQVEKTVDLFTHIKLVDNKWLAHQEIKDNVIEETRGEYPKDELPWQALRWTKITGENYGRGLVEELQGDLQSLEGLTQAIVEGSAAAAKVLFLVKPNGTTQIKDIAQKRNGGFAPGNAEDVTTLQLQKFNDFRVALETINGITSRLEKAFLLNSSVQRSGERVTAEEIRFLANELETALGGVYAVLSQEFQLPLVKAIIRNLTSKGKLPKMPGTIKPMIVTGLEALGRNHDLNKLDDFVSDMAQKFGPEAVSKFIHIDDYFRRRATALGIDIKGLIKTPEEVAADDQAAQQQQALQSMAPNIVNQVGNLASTKTKVAAQAAQQSQQPQ